MISFTKMLAACLTSNLLALPLAGAEFVKNGSFENGKIVPWWLSKPNQNVSLSIVSDSGSPCGGTGALSITLSKEQRIDITQNVKIGPGKYKLTAYMDTTRCTRSGGYIMLYLSGSVNGKWHNFGCVATPGTRRSGWKKTEWQKYEKIVTVPEGGVIKNVNIALINNLTGTVMVDGISICDYNPDEQQDMQFEKKTSERESKQKTLKGSLLKGTFHVDKNSCLYLPEETPEQFFELKNPTSRETVVQVRFTTTDYFGRKVLKKNQEFKLPANGKISETLHYPECRLPGFYCTNAEWKSDGISGKAQASFVKVGPVPEKKDPLFGFNNDSTPERLALMGAGSVMIQLRWGWWFNAKPEKLAKLKRHLEDLRKHGIEPVGDFQMHYGSSWRQDEWKRWMPKGKVPAGQKEPNIQDLKEVLIPFIEKVVALYKPYINTWFLGGEVESGYQRYSNALNVYIEMIKFTSETIRRIDPEATVQGIGIAGFKSNPIFPFMPKVLPSVKDCIDGIAPDIYPVGQIYGKGYINANTEDAGFRTGMLKVVEMAKVTRKGFVSNAESGPSIVRSTPLDDPCGISMANIQARQYILLKTIPNMRHWLYYRMDNWNPKNTIDWGMWEKGNPRQVVSAYAATARIMAFAEFVKELPLHQDIPCWIFKKDGAYFAAIWYNGKENLKVKLSDGIYAEAKDVQGNPIKLKNRIILLGEAPVYLYASSPAALEKLLKKASDDVPELVFDIDRQKTGKIIIIVKNQSGHQIDLELKKAKIPGGQTILFTDRFSLASGEVRTIEKSIGADSVILLLETGKGRKYTVPCDLKSVKVPFVNSFAELEWKAVPQLLNDPVRQIAAYDDLKTHRVYTGLDDLSAVFRLGYDKQYLYLEVRVKDDVHMNDNPPGKLYNGDSIQFAVDTLRDAKMKRMRGIKGYSNDDFNFVSGLVKGKPATWCFAAPPEKRSAMLEQPYRLKPEITRDEKTKTTLYRVKLAFSDLSPLKPEKGRIFGFSLLVFDKDSPTSFYHMDFTPGVSHPFDPSKYPAFKFE